MIPDLIQNEQGELVLTLLASRIGLALLYIAIAIVAARIVPQFVQRSVLAWAEMRYGGNMGERRKNTITRLMLTLTRAAIVAIAAIAVLSLFVDSAGLFTFFGLFTAAMGIALRQPIGDYISGFIFLFEDLFAIGDEVEVGGERGTVEDVTMRTTSLRAPTGELRIVPNSDIRTVHNFARTAFCSVHVQVSVPAAQFATAFEALEGLALQLPDQVPALFGAPQVLAEDGVLDSSGAITIRATAGAGSEDEVRRRMMEAVQVTLAESGIPIGAAAGA